MGKFISSMSNYVLEQIMNYDWPGNIRELEHVIERSILLCDDDILRQIYLPLPRQHNVAKRSEDVVVIKTIEENERDHILNMLKYCNGRVSGYKGAAKCLGIPPSTLSSKLKRLGIQKGHF